MTLTVFGASLLELQSNDGTLMALIEDTAANRALMEACCCGRPECCGCDRIVELDAADHDLTVTISGAITGGATIEKTAGGGCARWEGPAILTDNCGGEFGEQTLTFECNASNELSLSYSSGGGGCTLTAPELVSFQCRPLRVEFKAFTQELFGGGCPCGDGVQIDFLIEE